MVQNVLTPCIRYAAPIYTWHEKLTCWVMWCASTANAFCNMTYWPGLSPCLIILLTFRILMRTWHAADDGVETRIREYWSRAWLFVRLSEQRCGRSRGTILKYCGYRFNYCALVWFSDILRAFDLRSSNLESTGYYNWSLDYRCVILIWPLNKVWEHFNG